MDLEGQYKAQLGQGRHVRADAGHTGLDLRHGVGSQEQQQQANLRRVIHAAQGAGGATEEHIKAGSRCGVVGTNTLGPGNTVKFANLIFGKYVTRCADAFTVEPAVLTVRDTTCGTAAGGAKQECRIN